MNTLFTPSRVTLDYQAPPVLASPQKTPDVTQTIASSRRSSMPTASCGGDETAKPVDQIASHQP